MFDRESAPRTNTETVSVATVARPVLGEPRAGKPWPIAADTWNTGVAVVWCATRIVITVAPLIWGIVITPIKELGPVTLHPLCGHSAGISQNPKTQFASQTDRNTERQKDRKTERRTDAQTDGRTDGQFSQVHDQLTMQYNKLDPWSKLSVVYV